MIKKVVVDTGSRSAQENMMIDEKLLLSLKEIQESILHFYDWETFAITHGYFINTKQFFCLENVTNYKIQLVRRPTGGGIVFHYSDFAFSFLIPSSSKFFFEDILSNYAFINGIVIKAFRKTFGKNVLLAQKEVTAKVSSKNFCMAQPTKYDIMLGDRKIGGAAQRKVSHGFLHQGSILLGGISQDIFDKFLLPQIATTIYEHHKYNSFSILGDNWTQSELLEAREAFKISLNNAFISEN